MLLENGADAHARGEMPLYYAIFNRNKKTIDMLLEYGADISKMADHYYENLIAHIHEDEILHLLS